MIPRVIPCLLLQERCLYKTIRFKAPTYVGDAINAVRILNEKEIDELVFIDFRASINRREPSLEVVSDIASECFMPLAYGGGVKTLLQVESILHAGAEKVILSSIIGDAPELVREAATKFGSQAIVAALDYKRNILGRIGVYARSGKTKVSSDPVAYAKYLEDLGVGEIFLNSIDRDGMQCGYDLDMIRRISDAVGIPVIACGGARNLSDLRDAVDNGASAVAAGSMFVFHGKRRAVLITYPERHVLEELFTENKRVGI